MVYRIGSVQSRLVPAPQSPIPEETYVGPAAFWHQDS
jgi:hypothetical protein